MSEVIHNAPEEFWRPPIAPAAPALAMVEVCDRCETEFMVGARFCYVCGAARAAKARSTWGHPSVHSWAEYLRFLEVLEFHRVKAWLGLPLASLIAFFGGMGCILAAISVGFIYSVQNFADFQAIQMWRMEWLLGAVAAFVGGLLLKRSGVEKKSSEK
jgi:hypothetical protein